MGKLEKQPLEPEIGNPLEPHAAMPEPDERASSDQPAANWEGYSIEILSIWFDP